MNKILLLICLILTARVHATDFITFERNELQWSCRIVTSGINGESGTRTAVCWSSGINARDWRKFAQYTGGNINLRNDIRSADPRYNDISSVTFDDLTPEEKCESLEKSNPANCSLSSLYSTAPNGCSGGAPQYYRSAHRTANYASAACNPHDICYSNLSGPSKSSCDSKFRADLFRECDRAFTAYDRRTGEAIETIAGTQCKATAWAMYAGVNYVSLISNRFYNSAKEEAACKEWKDEMEAHNCD